ncbi:MAG: hypothetical protein WBF99_01225 [Xanthobacteraceae bacterium]
MIDALKKLSPLLLSFVDRLIDAAKASAATEGRRYVEVDGTGLTLAAIRRAAHFFVLNISANPTDVDKAGPAFAHAWSLGETETMRRVMTAISSPEAKGREIEVVQAMMRGASIDEALAKRDTAPVAQSGSVVTFHSRGVASTSKDE